MTMRCIIVGILCFSAPNYAVSQSPSLVGSESCGGSTCHGNRVGLGPAWNHSLSQFLNKDPHAEAGLLLKSSGLSRRIVHALDQQAKDSQQRYDAVLRKRCISCHVTSTRDDCESSEELSSEFLAKGVSCESCHGAAGDWIDAHVLTSFASHRSQTSIRDTASVIGRARTCVRCHVGSRSDENLVRDMNHDLIAAGHPALRFDLLTYNEILPTHWDSASNKNNEFNRSKISTRKISRWISLAASAKLAGERVDAYAADAKIPFPEFSDYDCFACHHSLKTFQQRQSALKISEGLPVWNAWHSVGQLKLYDNPGWLKKLSPRKSKPRELKEITLRIAQYYDELAAKGVEPVDPRADFQSLVKSINDREPYDWHEAAVMYLMLDAAVQDIEIAEGSEIAKSLRIGLDNLIQQLRFAQTPDSSIGLQSPRHFDAAKFRAAVIRQFVPTSEAP